ncbi:hypothetical protein FZ041_03310 [Selenomonas caprae]|uniref:CDP-glycerol--glycerophosphate glycerophosphotransferase n=1 Tax=Selenomonas caprae TaxID=2606905 RepID=A0A5D6WRX9_9FIRM|nr:CDP-glycerol glycerophosphotransferase family protein [Selenomonas caprae]TYZ29955.1 hypothetical protein FZ041_03310 [Selenomonas caprae]
MAISEKIYGENGDLNHENYGKNEAYEYCKSFFDDTINGYENKKWFDLQVLNPDDVFVNRPYDIHMPPQYRSEVLSKYCKLCFIPYAYCENIWTTKISYYMYYLDSVFIVFTENMARCKDLNNVYKRCFHANWKKIAYLGFTRFDLHKTALVYKSDFKKVVWLPRWSTDKTINPSTFFKFKDSIIKFFKTNIQYQLICRPHPLMLRNYVSSGEMTKKEEEFIALFDEIDNFLLDSSPDYLSCLKAADVIVSDWSSLLVEEIATGNPVIYCGSDKGWNLDAKYRSKLMYKAHIDIELINNLQTLLNGNDPLQGKRIEYINSSLRHDGKTGERIVSFLIDDYMGRVQKNSLKKV